ncbi:hypothetical protein VNO80_20717 [Phaseolus coccineus]|uniref:Transmembrane protein n=1 Tax=Phaseolus coccineus TaxID=3886 RepID=A0AAN9QSE0_PHACN
MSSVPEVDYIVVDDVGTLLILSCVGFVFSFLMIVVMVAMTVEKLVSLLHVSDLKDTSSDSNEWHTAFVETTQILRLIDHIELLIS